MSTYAQINSDSVEFFNTGNNDITLTCNGSGTINLTSSLGGPHIGGLVTPTLGDHAVNKDYVDSSTGG